MNKDPFEECIIESEPEKFEKAYAWKTAIGLQAVDGLKTSNCLLQTAIRNVEGEIWKLIMRKTLPIVVRIEPKKRIRWLDGLQHYSQSEPLLSLQMNIYPFIKPYLMGFIPMRGK